MSSYRDMYAYACIFVKSSNFCSYICPNVWFINFKKKRGLLLTTKITFWCTMLHVCWYWAIQHKLHFAVALAKKIKLTTCSPITLVLVFGINCSTSKWKWKSLCFQLIAIFLQMTYTCWSKHFQNFHYLLRNSAWNESRAFEERRVDLRPPVNSWQHQHLVKGETHLYISQL